MDATPSELAHSDEGYPGLLVPRNPGLEVTIPSGLSVAQWVGFLQVLVLKLALFGYFKQTCRKMYSLPGNIDRLNR